MASAGVAMAKARAAKAINLIISSLPVSMHGFVATNKKPLDAGASIDQSIWRGHLLSEGLVLRLMRARAALFPGCAVS